MKPLRHRCRGTEHQLAHFTAQSCPEARFVSVPFSPLASSLEETPSQVLFDGRGSCLINEEEIREFSFSLFIPDLILLMAH